MKRIALIGIAILFVSSATAQEKTTANKWSTFLQQSQMPDGTKYMSAPPDTSSIEYLNDFHQYQWGKSVRRTERGSQAVFDTNVSTDSIMKGFAEPFGMSVTKENTPEIYDLIERVINDAGNSVHTDKNKYGRKRPYVQYNESTAVPTEEKELRHSGSYPSGHSARGWTVTLVLTEINTTNQSQILKHGYEYGQNRVIAGYHYQSNVDAARLAAGATVARLHADETFASQMAKAKKGLEKHFDKSHTEKKQSKKLSNNNIET